MKKQSNIYKHLNRGDRATIESMLNQGRSLQEIADILGRSCSSISREIRRNREKVDRSSRRKFNGGNPVCELLDHFPLCCNGCPKKSHCRSDGFTYNGEAADEKYKTSLSESRKGVDVTKEELLKQDDILADGVKRGLSPAAIKELNPEMLPSVRTIYRRITLGQTTVTDIDLRRKVTIRPRKHQKVAKCADKGRFIGRTYIDYLRYLREHPSCLTVQVDTVEGRQEIDHKCILTLHLPDIHLMLMEYLENRRAAEVMRAIEPRVDPLLSLNPNVVLLTDRGVEFTDLTKLEERGLNVFFCDAYKSSQKGAIESNHRNLRFIFPKRYVMNEITPELVAKARSMIANKPCSEMGGTSPYDACVALYGEEAAKALGIKKVDATNIDLRPLIRRG